MTAPITTETIEPITDVEGWAHLHGTAESVWAVQEARIALTNRSSATERQAGSVNDILAAAIGTLAATERALVQDLITTMREVAPAGVLGWIAGVRGIGEPSVARLLGEIGHPRLALPQRYEGEGSKRALVAGPSYQRTVSQLWQYCGVGDPDLKATRGMSQQEMFRLGKPRAKSLVYVISEGAVKASRGEGPYRAIYDDARAHYLDRSHARDCPPCHAKQGEPWRPGHQHAAALRKVGKEILKDLWIAAK